jgi:DNA-binding phage protein
MRDDAQQLVDRVLAEVRRQGLTPMDVAQKTGLAYGAVHKFLNGASRRPTWHTVVLVAQAAGMTVRISGK